MIVCAYVKLSQAICVPPLCHIAGCIGYIYEIKGVRTHTFNPAIIITIIINITTTTPSSSAKWQFHCIYIRSSREKERRNCGCINVWWWWCCWRSVYEPMNNIKYIIFSWRFNRTTIYLKAYFAWVCVEFEECKGSSECRRLWIYIRKGLDSCCWCVGWWLPIVKWTKSRLWLWQCLTTNDDVLSIWMCVCISHSSNSQNSRLFGI